MIVRARRGMDGGGGEEERDSVAARKVRLFQQPGRSTRTRGWPSGCPSPALCPRKKWKLAQGLGGCPVCLHAAQSHAGLFLVVTSCVPTSNLGWAGAGRHVSGTTAYTTQHHLSLSALAIGFGQLRCTGIWSKTCRLSCGCVAWTANSRPTSCNQHRRRHQHSSSSSYD
jgi:hypothetical protein